VPARATMKHSMHAYAAASTTSPALPQPTDISLQPYQHSPPSIFPVTLTKDTAFVELLPVNSTSYGKNL
jgi:hypothetical protein